MLARDDFKVSGDSVAGYLAVCPSRARGICLYGAVDEKSLAVVDPVDSYVQRRYSTGELGGGVGEVGRQETRGRWQPEANRVGKPAGYVLCLISVNSCPHRVRCLPGFKDY
jgi:hypothetical protein